MIPLLIVTAIIVGLPLLVIFTIGVLDTLDCGEADAVPLLAVLAMMMVCLTASGITLYQNRHVPLVAPEKAEATP